MKPIVALLPFSLIISNQVLQFSVRIDNLNRKGTSSEIGEREQTWIFQEIFARILFLHFAQSLGNECHVPLRIPRYLKMQQYGRGANIEMCQIFSSAKYCSKIFKHVKYLVRPTKSDPILCDWKLVITFRDWSWVIAFSNLHHNDSHFVQNILLNKLNPHFGSGSLK